jgi:hypothetical protein
MEPKCTDWHDSIGAAFHNLSELSSMVYDYWLSVLYTDDGDIAWEEWNEDNLKLMETDIMNLST